VLLSGLRVATTRPEGAAHAWLPALRDAGAHVTNYPAIAVTFPENWQPLDAALGEIERFEWLAFTSANAARSVATRLGGTRIPSRVRVAAVGTATGAVVGGSFRRPDFTPVLQSAEGLARELPIEGRARVLFPAGDLAGDDFERILADRGADVLRVEAYRTIPGAGIRDLASAITEAKVDAVVFSSPSSIGFVADRFESNGGSLASALERGRISAVCIGTSTAGRAAQLGLKYLTSRSPEIGAIIETLKQATAPGDDT
jgi:uroporphyrinogen-III synthase